MRRYQWVQSVLTQIFLLRILSSVSSFPLEEMRHLRRASVSSRGAMYGCDKDPAIAEEDATPSLRRRVIGTFIASPFAFLNHERAQAASVFPSFGLQSTKSSSLFVLSPLKNTTALTTPLIEAQLPAFEELSSELCLLRLLPVKNPFFRELQSTIEGLSTLRLSKSADSWTKATKTVKMNGIDQLDRKRGLLQPVFNPEENTMLQILKAERFEILIETLRTRLVDISIATNVANATETFVLQKQALLTLSEIGELLVADFPYQVPTEGLYSYLPRLLGRCKVTFTFRRGKKILGNMTLVADGYTAPITAGNFIDLCERGFYNGLPVKFARKQLGAGNEFEVANLPILGSFNDGFYDPLTAKPRRLPLELIRLGKVTGQPDMTYSQEFAPNLGETSDAVLVPKGNSRPLLSFKIRGLLAMNHPDKKPNGASSEFFALQADSVMEDKTTLLDGDYAPFGYIIEGYDVFQKLKASDVIETTKISEFGVLNLVKLRMSSFNEVIQGSSDRPES